MATRFGRFFVAHSRCSLFFILVISQVYGDYREENPRDYLKKDHSLVKPYTGQGMNVPMWDFQGSTVITNTYIRLTPDHQSKQGSIWNRMPCYIRDWELQLQFKVHGSGKGNLFGDGFAVWYTKERLQPGPVFGNKDYFTGLGLFFDTYSNHNGPHRHKHPYLSAQINNGTLHYDHDVDGTHTEISGCETAFRNRDYDTYVSIRYLGSQQRLTVKLDLDDKAEWKECFDVRGVQLPTSYYFGASAKTGQLADNHDIISMKLYQLEVSVAEDEQSSDYSQIKPSAEFFAPPRDHTDDKGAYKNTSLSIGKAILLFILILIGVAVCVWVGLIIFQKKQERARKRFY